MLSRVFIFAVVFLSMPGTAFLQAQELVEPNDLEALLNQEDFCSEKMLEEMTNFIESMSPEEYEKFEQTRRQVEDEFAQIISTEADRLGMTPEKYFEKEFSDLFENQNVMLAQGQGPPPGKEVMEGDFGVGMAAPGANPKKTSSGSNQKRKERKKSERKRDKPDKNDNNEPESKPKKSSGSKKLRDSGNWVKKLSYYREAEKMMSEAVKLLEEIRSKRAGFYRDQLDEIDETLESFFRKVGVERGNSTGLSEYIETVVGYKINALSDLEKNLDSSPDESLDMVLYQVEERVDSLKIELASAKSEIEMIVDLDRTVNERISSLDEHIASAEQDFSQMEEVLRKIDETYSHLDAAEFFGQIEGFYDRIVAIDQYVQEVGAKNIEKMKNSVNSSTQKINDKVKKMNEEATKLLDKMEKSTVKAKIAKPKAKKTVFEQEQDSDSKEKAQTSAKAVFGKIKSAFYGREKSAN